MLSAELLERAKREGTKTVDMSSEEYYRDSLRALDVQIPTNFSDQEMELVEPLDLTQKNNNRSFIHRSVNTRLFGPRFYAWLLNCMCRSRDADHEDCNGQLKVKSSSPEHEFPCIKGAKKSTKMMLGDSSSRVASGVRPNQRGTRGYTNEELEAALQDIQSGKLGTRYAAIC